MGENKCSLCQENAELKCSGCKQVWYCGKEHQKKHWKEHKASCRPFTVSKDLCDQNRYVKMT